MTTEQSPICYVPWTSILVDTNKDVKPCCAYSGKLGNLNKNTLTEIISGPEWTDVKDKLSNQIWPTSCEGCRDSEINSGWSVRQSMKETNWSTSCNDKITFLELNGSNICNLACLHCSPKFSSKWLNEWNLIDKTLNFLHSNNNPGPHNFSVDTELILKNLKELDLSQLNVLMLKGGDPMLNEETLEALRYFDELDILKKLQIVVFTNGTTTNEEILYFLNKAKQCHINISVDGIGRLNEYIRYGKGSNTEELKKNIKIYKSSIKNIFMKLSVSTMIYNIFNIVEIRDFWIEVMPYSTPSFNIIVSGPEYLDPRILPDDIRKELIHYYEKHQLNNEFEKIIKHLSMPYLGDKIHNDWVKYTESMEKLRQNSIVELVPQFKEILKYK
jgi:MoaA/NifB/PqqE/SkfB family radical SAM enzyme